MIERAYGRWRARATNHPLYRIKGYKECQTFEGLYRAEVFKERGAAVTEEKNPGKIRMKWEWRVGTDGENSPSKGFVGFGGEGLKKYPYQGFINREKGIYRMISVSNGGVGSTLFQPTTGWEGG